MEIVLVVVVGWVVSGADVLGSVHTVEISGDVVVSVALSDVVTTKEVVDSELSSSSDDDDDTSVGFQVVV